MILQGADILKLIYWGGILLAAYTWILYPLLLMLLGALLKQRDGITPATRYAPSVMLLITVHNEEQALAAKIENSLQLRYPNRLLDIVIASDGSTDRTVEIAGRFVAQHSNVFLHSLPGKNGKSLTQNEAIRRSNAEIIVFTDADTVLRPDFIEKVVRPFSDSRVGCVAGRLVWRNPGESSISQGGSLYWRFENFLWRLESRLGLLAWASGACMAVRRDLFKPMEPQYGEDCVVPLDIVSQGCQVLFAREAIAFEYRIAEPSAEFRARVRMTLRSFAGTLSRKSLLNPFTHPWQAWVIYSHKVFRWLTPYFLILAFTLNLLWYSSSPYRELLLAQAFLYSLALLGLILERKGKRIPIASSLYAFCLANAAMLIGVGQWILGKRIVWYRSQG